ncbi:hypothetical protein DEFDS_P089 (plasmid) [Deferribacter desulfuricans SSM1]|uniref:Uncharacterized protein n=1 Tax=Deferribacter desulfuricans (strain DSM 14783 / JCM 11476 / NBRC 101012 / SSM1) TaxID=639282 RepID=D3PES0_DEFDS|nr:hypothetical protein [Deferribacter desulfuricans]BAI81712.1 hypothetical protein DEFDS_P089 [Deferribacter desulfuricans SSM1]
MGEVITKMKIFSGTISYNREKNSLNTYPTKLAVYNDADQYLNSYKLTTNQLIKLTYTLKNLLLGDTIENVNKGQELTIIEDSNFSLKLANVSYIIDKSTPYRKNITKIVLKIHDKKTNTTYTIIRDYKLLLKLLYQQLNKYCFKLKDIPQLLYQYALFRLNDPEYLINKTKSTLLYNFLVGKMFSLIDVINEPIDKNNSLNIYLYINNFKSKSNKNKISNDLEISYSIKQNKQIVDKGTLINLSPLYSLLHTIEKEINKNKRDTINISLEDARSTIFNFIIQKLHDQINPTIHKFSKKFNISGNIISYLLNIAELITFSITTCEPYKSADISNQLLYTLLTKNQYNIDIIDSFIKEYKQIYEKDVEHTADTTTDTVDTVTDTTTVDNTTNTVIEQPMENTQDTNLIKTEPVEIELIDLSNGVDEETELQEIESSIYIDQTNTKEDELLDPIIEETITNILVSENENQQQTNKNKELTTLDIIDVDDNKNGLDINSII